MPDDPLISWAVEERESIPVLVVTVEHSPTDVYEITIVEPRLVSGLAKSFENAAIALEVVHEMGWDAAIEFVQSLSGVIPAEPDIESIVNFLRNQSEEGEEN